MELDAADVVQFEDRGVGNDVIAGGGRGRDNGAIVAVSEIEEWRIARATKQTRLTTRRDLVPTHVWNALLALESRYRAFEDAEAALLGRFLAGCEESLQAQADAEEGNARADELDEGLPDAQIVEGAHRLAKVAA